MDYKSRIVCARWNDPMSSESTGQCHPDISIIQTIPGKELLGNLLYLIWRIMKGDVKILCGICETCNMVFESKEFFMVSPEGLKNSISIKETPIQGT
jgi:hypothetical protein